MLSGYLVRFLNTVALLPMMVFPSSGVSPAAGIDRGALRYLLLDAIPLTDDIALQRPLFADALQEALLDAYLAADTICCAQCLRRSQLIVGLACDLGVIDEIVCAYVCRSIDRLTASVCTGRPRRERI